MAECPEIPVLPQDLCIVLPGGVELCAQWPGAAAPNALELSKQLMAQVNAALTPLTPIFNIIDTIIALKDCAQALPDALGPPPDPEKLTECIPNLLEAVDKLLALVPQLSVPLMILGLIDMLLAYMAGLIVELQLIIIQQAKIADALLAAQEPGNEGLLLVIECAEGQVTARLENLENGAAPVNRLIGLINTFASLVGLPEIPEFGGLGEDLAETVGELQEFVKALQDIRNVIPV